MILPNRIESGIRRSNQELIFKSIFKSIDKSEFGGIMHRDFRSKSLLASSRYEQLIK